MGVGSPLEYVSTRMRGDAAPLPGDWSFWCDTITGQVPLGPVQPRSFYYTRRLSGWGDGNVTLPVASAALEPARLLRLWSWRLWAFFRAQPAWCGVPSGISDEGRGSVTLTLTELPAYLKKRQFDVPGITRFDQAEQTAIAAFIAAPAVDVGVQLETDPGSGVARDRSYEYLEGENRAALLVNLSSVIGGPEFRSQYRWTAEHRPQCVLRIAYPRVGSDTGLGSVVPGTAVSYRATWDSDSLRTRTFAIGDVPESAPEGTPKPVAVEDRPQPDLPRLDEADDWPQTYLDSTLRERAATAAHQYADPVLELSVTETEMLEDPTAYNVGDDVRVHIVSPLMPGGLDLSGRLTEIGFNAAEARADWTIAITLPPPQPRATLTRRLDSLDAVLAGIFRRRLTIL